QLARHFVGGPLSRRLLEDQKEHVDGFDRVDVRRDERLHVCREGVARHSSPPSSSSTPSARITAISTSSVACSCPSGTCASARASAASTVPARISLTARPLAVRP